MKKPITSYPRQLPRTFPQLPPVTFLITLLLCLFSQTVAAGTPLPGNASSATSVNWTTMDWTAPAPGFDQLLQAAPASITNVANFLPTDGCFSGINAGDNITFCAGEAATLDGGYDGTYSGPGTPTLTWTMPDGDEGTFFIAGVDQGNTATAANFNNSENGITGLPAVTFVPDPGVTEIRLRLGATTSGDPDCTATEVEDVTIFFDLVQDSPTEVSVQGVLEIDFATGLGNTVTMENGETFKLESDEEYVIDNGQQFDDIRKYNYTITSSGIDGLPVSGIGTQTQFNAAFNDLVLTNTTCDVATATIEIFAFYDRNAINVPQPSGDCAGPITEIIVNVEPRPTIESTLASIDDILIVCEDDDQVEVVVTGTPLTTITYTIDYGDGSPITSSLDLDENGVDNTSIVLDANNASGDEMTVTLTGGAYTDDAPGCPVALSEVLTFGIVPLPALTIDFVNPADTVICYDVNEIFFLVGTPSGPGTYSYTYDVLLDGEVVLDDLGSTVTLEEGQTGLAIWRIFYSDIINTFGNNGVITILIDGESITKDGLDGTSCTNASPNVSISFLVQDDSYVEYEASVDGGSPQSLTEENTSLDLAICDGQSINFDQVAPLADNSRNPFISGALQVEIDDDQNLLGLGDDVVLTYDFDGNPFEFDQVFDIPNSQTTDANITVTITPYFEDNDLEGLNGDECVGDPVTLNITVQPAPTVTVIVSDPVVCDGETVLVTVTSSVPGTAKLIINQGGAPITIIVEDQDPGDGDGGPYLGFYTSAPLDVMTQFTVTTFVGSGDPSCSATVNQMVMTDVEEEPTATITVDDDYLCDGDDTFVTFTGSGGSNAGYKFVYSIDGGPDLNAMTDGIDSSVNVDLTDLAPGDHFVTLVSVANTGGLMCSTEVNSTVNIDVEATPEVTDLVDDNICSGTSFSQDITSTSPDPSAIASNLYFLVEIVNPVGGTPLSAAYVVAADDAPTFAGTPVNVSGVPQDITIQVTPFYFPDGAGDPVLADVADACKGEPIDATITVETVPNATFGGDETICEGESALLTITGPANGEVNIDIVDANSVVLGNLGTFALDAGGEANVPTGALSATTIFQITNISTDPSGDLVCTRASTFERTIFVIPTPDAEVVAPRTVNICEGTETTFSITGTPNAVVEVTPNNGDPAFEVTLDGNGDGSFSTGILTSNIRYDLTLVTITEQNNGAPQPCSFVPDNRAIARVRIDPAPTGALVSNRILCAGDTPQIQFNATNGDGYTGTYTIVVNGVTYTGISNGDVLDLGADAGAMVSTDFTLESIVQDDAPFCSDIIVGDIYTVEAVVNQIPTASLDVQIEGTTTTVTDGVNDPFEMTICSGDEVDFSLSGTPSMSNSGDPLFFEIMVTADDAGLTSGAGTYRVDELDAATLSAALGLPADFVNPSSTTDAKLTFMVTPYYEYDPAAPIGFMNVGGLDTEGFVDGFAPGQWNTSEGSASDVSFTTNELTLEAGAGPVIFGVGPDDSAIASIDFPEEGFVSFDVDFDIEADLLVSDLFIIDFEGFIIYNSPIVLGQVVGNVTGSESFSGAVPGGSTLTFALFGDGTTFLNRRSTVVISNWLFDPAAQPCPGEKIAVDITIKPALEADFDDEALTVCEGDQPEICLTGTPDATVTVFLGDGVFTDVKLGPDGTGCFTPTSGLLPPSIKYTITGITTLGQDPECSLIYGATGPMLIITVTPTPFASVTIDPATVCANDEAFATITGTPNATVTYSLDGGLTTADVLLDGTGTGSVLLPTEYDGLEVAMVVISLSNVAVTINDVTCEAPLTEDATLTIRPLPSGIIEAGDPVCNGGEVPITFTATTPVENDYNIRITGPDDFDEIFVVASGEVVFNATVPGDYTLRRIRDGVGSDLVCTRTGQMSTTTVIIEEIPSLTANISGTVGTASLDNQTILNAFRAVACDMATVDAEFGSSTLVSDPGTADPLYVQVDVLNNDDLMLGLPAGPTTFVVPFAGLTFAGILDNVDDIGNSNITVTLTPYFENGTDTGALNDEECAGPTLRFNITILPAVTLDFDGALSTDDVCEGDVVTVTLTGSPGGVVSFSTNNLLDVTPSPITLDGGGAATITATAGPYAEGDASVTLDMIQVMTNVGGINRMCMEMPDIDFDIIINEKPLGMIFADPAGPICNGEAVEVFGMLVDTDFEAGDSYTFTVDGTDYTVTVDAAGKALLFNSGALTETTSFELTSVSDDETGCGSSIAEGDITVEVEDIPAGMITATGDVPETVIEGGVPATLSICANESIDLVASMSTIPLTPGAENFVSVTFSDPLNFYGLGTSGTVALSLGAFESNFSTQYTMISGNPVTVTLEVTYYIETDPLNEGDKDLGSEECMGITDLITIIINPNPKTADITDMTCSGVALLTGLNEGITNGVAGATFTYTVSSPDGLTAPNRPVPSSDAITDVFTNITTGDQTITYTVTPYGPTGCEGNDFDLVVTIKPEPVIIPNQVAEVCSGVITACVPLLSNETDADNVAEDTDLFEVISITYSLESAAFVADIDNAQVGAIGNYLVIALDEFTNTSSEPQTVTYVIRPTSANGCVGDDETIVVTILPEPVVADFMVKVCSGGAIDLSIMDGLTGNGVGNEVFFTRSALPLTTLRIFDETGADVTLATFGGSSTSNAGLTGINDSYLNQGTATLSVFYDVEILNGECESATFLLEVKVLEETNVVLEPIAGQTAICAGEPITLVSNFDGTATPSYAYSVMEADPGVSITLTPSAAGGEVLVDGSGSGNATIMVMVTDANGCVAMGTRIVSVGESPEAQAISGPTDPCLDAFTFFSVADNDGSTYQWALSNPAAGEFTPGSEDEPVTSIVFDDAAGMGPFVLSVTETNADGCSTTNTLSITLTDELTVDFSAQGNVGGDPLTVAFTENAAGNISGYLWTFGDGTTSTLANPVHTFPENPNTPGEPFIYDVTLEVFGSCSPFNDEVTKPVAINSNAETRTMTLVSGINFISFDVSPLDKSASSVFGGISMLNRVLAYTPTGAKVYIPGAGSASTLLQVEDGAGYIVIVGETQPFEISGEPIDPSFKKDLVPGINYIGMMAPGSVTADDFFQLMVSNNQLVVSQTFGNNIPGFQQNYFPGAGSANTMENIVNGFGYMVIANESVAGADYREQVGTEVHDFVYGNVIGYDPSLGEEVEIIDESDRVIGKLLMNANGSFKATPLYGSVERQDGTIIDALELDEVVRFRYNGQIVDADLTFSGSMNATEVNLEFATVSSTPDVDYTSSVKAFPNPFADRITIRVSNAKPAFVSVMITDITGRAVTRLLNEEMLPAGITDLEWTPAADVPAGSYLIVVSHDGKVLPNSSQQIVKLN